MAPVSGEDFPATEGESELSTERLAAIHAAMLEELGFARKDTLPLEDKKGISGKVDLEALENARRANDPRSLEFRIAREHSDARAAWKNAKFDDVEESDLGLDTMNSGQSHRQRMKAGLLGSGDSSSGIINRGGRGLPSLRGGHLVSGHDDRKNLGHPKRGNNARLNVNVVLSHLRGQDPPRGKAARRTIESARAGHPKLPRHSAIASVPKSNLSFGDRRSINVLPMENIPTPSGTAAAHPSNDPQPKRVIELADPEIFFAQAWPGNSGGNSIDPDQNLPLEKANLQSTKHDSPIYDIPVAQDRESISEEGRLDQPGNLQESCGLLGIQNSANATRFVVHKATTKIENIIRGSTIALGTGEIRIVSVTSGLQTSYIIEIEVLGKMVLEQLLEESFHCSIDASSLIFDADFGGQSCKWKMTTPLPWIGQSFQNAIERYKSQSTSSLTVDPRSAARFSDRTGADDAESLISFSDEVPIAIPFVSSFAQDLLSLMKIEAVDTKADAIYHEYPQPLSETSSTAVVELFPQVESSAAKGLAVSTGGNRKGAILGGLASSKFSSSQVEVGKYLRRKGFELSTEEASTLYADELTRRYLEQTSQKHGCKANVDRDVEMSGAGEQNSPKKLVFSEKEGHSGSQVRVRYTIDEMMEYRKNAAPISKQLLAEELVGNSYLHKNHGPRVAASSAVLLSIPQHLKSSEIDSKGAVSTTRFDITLVDGAEKPKLLRGLATSKYAYSPVSKPAKTERVSSVSQSGLNKLPKFFRSSKVGMMHNDAIEGQIKLLEPERLAKDSESSNAAASAEIQFKFPTLADDNSKSGGGLVRVSPDPDKDNSSNDEVVSLKKVSRFSASGSLGTSGRRDSLNSRSSKDSTETIKPSIKNTAAKLADLPADLHQSLSNSSSNRSSVSMDSNIFATSFATALEGGVSKLENIFQKPLEPSQGLQFNISKNDEDLNKHLTSLTSMSGLSKLKATEPASFGVPVDSGNTFGPEKHPKSLIQQSDSIDCKSHSSFKPFRVPAVNRQNDITKKLGGLASSRFATQSSDNNFSRSYLDLEVTPNIGSTGDQIHVKNRLPKRAISPIYPAIDGTLLGSYSPHTLNATASGFTPSTAIKFGLPSTRSLAPSVTSSISPVQSFYTQRIEPQEATVLVPDPMIPGVFREVTGLLKLGDIPIIAQKPAHDHQFPTYNPQVNENSAPDYASKSQISAFSTPSPLARSPLSPQRPKINSATRNMQEEIRERLQKSLATRRLS